MANTNTSPNPNLNNNPNPNPTLTLNLTLTLTLTLGNTDIACDTPPGSPEIVGTLSPILETNFVGLEALSQAAVVESPESPPAEESEGRKRGRVQ